MSVASTTKFAIQVLYNGLTEVIEVNLHQRVTAVLEHAVNAFHITQNRHLLSLFREDGSEVSDQQSVADAGLQPGERLALRPSAVKGGGTVIDIAAGALAKTFNIFATCGRGSRECVAFWVGLVGETRIDEALHPQHRSSRMSYAVDGDWMNRLWFRLANEGRRIHAQVHTHPSSAFHSESDDDGAVGVHAGFLSIVLPSFGSARSLAGARAYKMTATGWVEVAIESAVRTLS